MTQRRLTPNTIEKMIVINYTGLLYTLRNYVNTYVSNNTELFGTHTDDLNNIILVDMVSYIIRDMFQANGHIIRVNFYQDWPEEIMKFFKEVEQMHEKVFYSIMLELMPRIPFTNIRITLVPFMDNIHFYIKAERC